MKTTMLTIVAASLMLMATVAYAGNPFYELRQDVDNLLGAPGGGYTLGLEKVDGPSTHVNFPAGGTTIVVAPHTAICPSPKVAISGGYVC